MKSTALTLFYLFFAATCFAQPRVEGDLQRQLEGKTKFYDIKKTVHDFYLPRIKGLSRADSLSRKKMLRQTKQWNRWFYECESRLKPNGEVEDVARKLMAYEESMANRPSLMETAYGSWAHAGPNYVEEGVGRVNRLAADPSNGAILYAGSAGGGLYKTTNGGVSWSVVGSFLPALSISGIVLTSSNTIYVLTGDGDSYAQGGFAVKFGYIRYSVGVLKSTDGGTTWSRTAEFPGLANERYCGLRLVRDPNNANTLLAATTHGLFRTTNGGASWSLCALGNTIDNVMVFDVRFAPGSSSFVYCTIRDDNNVTQGTFLRSTDGGVNFPSSNTVSFSPNSFTNVERIAIGVTPASPDLVYLVAGPGNESNGTFKGLWRSTDRGANFTRLANAPDVFGADISGYPEQNNLNNAVVVSPNNENTIIFGSLVIFQSLSGGNFFVQETPYHGSASIHPDVHDLIYSNGFVYAATDGGVAVSGDNGASWSKRFDGLGCTQFYHFEPANEDGYLWGGTQDNGILIREDLTSTYDRFDGGDGYDVLTDVAPAGNYDDKWWVVNTNIYADATVTENVTPDQVDVEDNDNFFPNLAMHPANEDIIYAGYPSLYVSYSRGDNWAEIRNSEIPHYNVPGNWCISSCQTNGGRLYAAGRNGSQRGLFKINNLNSIVPDEVFNLTASLVSQGYNTDNKITDIAVSSNTSNRLWVTAGGFGSGKVFYSNDGGVNWTNLSAGLPDFPVNTVVADDNDNIYIGTDVGVFYRGANHSAWTPFLNGLPRVAVTDLRLYTAFATTLYASTYGRGIWVSEIFTDCVTDLTINSTQYGQKFYQAGNSITTTSTIAGGAGTNVFFRAGTSVTLTDGFVVNTATEFTAYVGGCNTGTPFRLANGDSLNITRNIRAARQFGFVDESISNGEAVSVKLNMFNGGVYTIRIYDADKGIYLSTTPATLVKGVNKVNIQVTQKTGNLRTDLFSGEMLVHYADIKN